MRRAEIEAIYAQGADAVITLVKALESRIEELERRLSQSSRNSSMPPSSDPPMTRAERRRAARERAKQISRRNVGGQPGHPGSHRELVANPDETLLHPPERCNGCGEHLTGGETVGEPVRHQVWELPGAVCTVTEHQRARMRCRCCGKLTLADLPAGVPASAFGPALQATVVSLSQYMSREQVATFVCDNFGCPISAASVEAICKRASGALAGVHGELRCALPEQAVVHSDETGWRWPSERRWAWEMGNGQIAVYHLTDTRSGRIARELIGEGFAGILVSDRYAGYNWLEPAHRQACFSHLLRDFQALAERGGRIAALGRELKRCAAEILDAHKAHVAEGRLVAWSEPELLCDHDRMMELLERGLRMRDQRTSRFCRGLLDVWPALWTFTEIPGVEPTNNRSERALRFAVLMRKRTGGTRTDDGDRFIERLLTVRETCRLQGRNLHDYLLAAITAALRGQPAPSLLPSGP